MKEKIRPIKQPKPVPVTSRPVFLTILCLFSYVFFSILSILFFIGIFWSGWVTNVINQYSPSEIYSKTQIMLIFIAGFLIHLLAFTGSILIWNLRKTGFYLLSLSCLIVAIFQSFQPQIEVTTTAIYILFLPLFGIFFRRLH
ncbi:MAG: hypothetical protein WCK84_11020 [Bacteroidota bacterium]